MTEICSDCNIEMKLETKGYETKHGEKLNIYICPKCGCMEFIPITEGDSNDD